MKKLSQLLPIDEVRDDFFITSYDTITYGYKVEMPEVYTNGLLEAEAFFNGYRSALNKLGTNVIVQKYGMFYEKKYESSYEGDSKTREWNEKKYDGRPVMDVDHFLFISFYFGNKNLASVKSPFTSSSLKSINDRRYHKIKASDIADYEKILGSFEITMGGGSDDDSSGICRSFERMKAGEIFHFLERFLSCNYNDSAVYDYTSYDNRDGLMVGNREVSVLNMRRMPSLINGFSKANGTVQEGSKFNKESTYKGGIKLRTSFLFPLAMGLPIEHIICETLVLLPIEKVEAALKKEQSQLRFFNGLGIPAANEKRDEITRFIAATSENDLTTCKYGLSIIFPHLKERKIELTNKVLDIAGNICNVQMFCENRSAVKTFFSNLPGCGHVLNDLIYGWTETLCMSTHIESYKNGNRDGIQFVDLFGKPFLFDFWDEKNKFLKARNAVFYAPTGEGKSFLTNHIVDQCEDDGDEIVIIDVDGSYKRLTELKGGIYYDSKNLSSFAFAPFKMAHFHRDAEGRGKWYPNKNALGKTENDVTLVEFLATLVLAIWFRGGENMEIPVQTKELTKDSIKDFYTYVNGLDEDKKVPMIFDSYYNFVIEKFGPELDEKKIERRFFDISGFQIMCKNFALGGEYGFLLNGDKHVQLDNKLVCFDLVAIKDIPDINQVVTLTVMNLVQTKLDLLDGRRLRFFIDEAVDFIRGGIFGDYIGGLFRKIRKRNGQIMIITQSIRFMLSGMDPLVMASIFGNTSIKILLNHSSDREAYPLIQKHLSFTDTEMELLGQMKVSEGTDYRLALMKFGDMPAFLFRVEVSRQTFATYNTDPKKVAEINKVAERTGSLVVGIETFVENESKNKASLEGADEGDDYMESPE